MTEIQEAVAQIKAAGSSKPRAARDPVNQPTINNWVEAIGDRNPIYVDEAAARAAGHPGIVAPPAMIQVWTMFGLGGERPKDDPLGPIMQLLDEAGYIGVVATNCEKTYPRYLRPGEEVSITSKMGDVIGPKQTALGEGVFGAGGPGPRRHDAPVVVAGHRVLLGGCQGARVADSAPAGRKPAAPAGARDVAGQGFADRLRGGQRQGHGVQLRGAPRAESARPHTAFRDRARGTRGGRAHARRAAWGGPRRRLDRHARARDVYRLSGRGYRTGVDPLRVGAAGGPSMSAPAIEVGTVLPELKLYGDPTFIISTALATRDFQDVHHDRDLAQAKGSKDIFVNILTDTGLVQRYVTDWAGPSALIKSIGLRLGVPWYAYDTVTFSGEVTAVEDGLITVKVLGRNSLGDHVIATATLTMGDA